MKVGFTGTRDGMSQHQKEQLVLLLASLGMTEFHHGDCVGADAQAHDIVREWFPDVVIHVRPPIIEFMRAFKTGDVMHAADDYISRDRAIVDSTDVLVGTPKDNNSVSRSGTWTTIRYAQKHGKVHYVIQR